MSGKRVEFQAHAVRKITELTDILNGMAERGWEFVREIPSRMDTTGCYADGVTLVFRREVEAVNGAKKREAVRA